MRFYLLLLIGFLGFSGCGESKSVKMDECLEDSLCIYTQLVATHSIIPNSYKANIKISESDALRNVGEGESSVKSEIANTINDILNASKDSGFCKGGGYELRPNIRYKDSVPINTIGYTLHFQLECDIKNEQKKQYDEFVASVDKLVSKNKYLAFIAPKVNAIATQDNYQEAYDSAFDKALSIAKDKQGHYSALLSKKCVLGSVDSLRAGAQPREALYSTMSVSNTQDEISWGLPTPKSQEIQAKIQAKYICK